MHLCCNDRTVSAIRPVHRWVLGRRVLALPLVAAPRARAYPRLPEMIPEMIPEIALRTPPPRTPACCAAGAALTHNDRQASNNCACSGSLAAPPAPPARRAGQRTTMAATARTGRAHGCCRARGRTRVSGRTSQPRHSCECMTHWLVWAESDPSSPRHDAGVESLFALQFGPSSVSTLCFILEGMCPVSAEQGARPPQTAPSAAVVLD